MKPKETPELKPTSDSENRISTTGPSIARMAAWDFSGRLANFGVIFVVGVMLTRLLSPAEFGAFAVVGAVISFSLIFVDLGFRSAIIQQQKVTDQQLSTVFFINLGIGVILTALLIAISGEIENFYQIAGLRYYISAASLLFVINALALVPGGLLQKDLRLKELSITNTIGAAFSGAVAVWLAFSGYGVWALVAQQLLSASIILGAVFSLSRWLPSLRFSFRSVNELWRYGIRIFAAGFSDTVFSRLDVFIIGKLFPLQTLGFYNRAQALDNLIKTLAASTTTAVAFPVISKIANDTEAVRAFYLRCLNLISFLAFLLIGVLFLTCFDIVIILFTEAWVDVGYYFRIMALTAFVYPISALMVNLIAARGNSGAFLKLELIKKGFLFPAYLSFFFGGVFLFLVVLGIFYLFALGLNAYFVKREIDIPMRSQFREIYKYGLISSLSTAAVYLMTFYLDNIYLHFVVTSLVFGAFYLFICYNLRLSGFIEVYGRICAFIDAKRNPNISTAS